MHMAVLCEVAQCIFVDTVQSVEGDRPDDGGGKLLRTVRGRCVAHLISLDFKTVIRC
jgi:hypothetical protein